MQIVKKLYNSYLIEVLIAVGYLLGLYWSYLHIPMVWDEGWNALAAKNWLEIGAPICPTFTNPNAGCWSSNFPLISLIAVSFKCFGYGQWQLRLPPTIISIITLTFFFLYIKRFWNRNTAILTFIFLSFLSWHKFMNPMQLGVLAFSENLGFLCLLLIGTILSQFPKISFRNYVVLSFVMGVGLFLKAQYVLFLPVSIMSLVLVMRMHRVEKCFKLVIPLSVGFLVYYALLHVEGSLRPIGSVVSSYAFHWSRLILNLDLQVRLKAINNLEIFALPVLIPVIYYFLCYIRKYPNEEHNLSKDSRFVARGFFLFFSFYWFVWVTFGAIAQVKYLGVAMFMGSPFLANFIYDAWSNFCITKSNRHIGLKQKIKLFGVLLVFIIFLFKSLVYFYSGTSMQLDSLKDFPQKRVLDFINTQLPTNAVIESNEAEFYFLLKKPYNFEGYNQKTFEEARVKENLNQISKTNPVYILVGANHTASENYPFLLDSRYEGPSWIFGSYTIYKYSYIN